jgi:hypothetical protein
MGSIDCILPRSLIPRFHSAPHFLPPISSSAKLTKHLQGPDHNAVAQHSRQISNIPFIYPLISTSDIVGDVVARLPSRSVLPIDKINGTPTCLPSTTVRLQNPPYMYAPLPLKYFMHISSNHSHRAIARALRGRTWRYGHVCAMLIYVRKWREGVGIYAFHLSVGKICRMALSDAHIETCRWAS